MSVLEKKYRKAQARTSKVLTSPDDNSIWSDEDFWKNRWPKLVDNEAELLEELCNQRMQKVL